jgi:hypothetical protein
VVEVLAAAVFAVAANVVGLFRMLLQSQALG